MNKIGIITAAVIVLMTSIFLVGVNTASAQANTDSFNNGNTAHLEGKPVVNATSNNITKAQILKDRGVPGNGINHAPGLQKPFNPKSKAAQNAGKVK